MARMTEYRIDDLARAAGTTTRNVRGYQDRGLIPKPIRRGRIAIYGDEHLERLKIINDLLARGFNMAHISEFLDGLQRGDGLAEVLGLQELVRFRSNRPPPRPSRPHPCTRIWAPTTPTPSTG